jgi:cation diffusion facilitator family transporter
MFFREVLMSAEANSKIIFIALAANLGIAAAKFAGAFISGSAALLAEAIHSVVDSSNQVLLLVGSKKSKHPPTERHPLGHGREAFFWSFIVAILLFSLGGLFAIYEGAHKLSGHAEFDSPWIALAILVVGLLLEGGSFFACLREVKRQNKFANLWRWFRNTSSSELLVIFTEDAAALLGLALAFVSILLSWITGNPVWDAVGSVAIGCLLVIVAILLAIEIKSLLIGEAPRTDFRSFIEERLKANIPGGKVFKLIALQTGSNEVLISCKISAGSVQDVDTLITGINRLEKEIKANFPEVRWLFVEPDVTD